MERNVKDTAGSKGIRTRRANMRRANAGCAREKAAPKSRLATLEQKAALIQKFTLFSNAFMSVALNDREACEYVLRILTGDHALCLKSVKTQYTILKVASHDAWLDVLAEARDGAVYALEVQVRDNVDHPHRARFYEAMIDSDMLEKGRPYEELPEVSLIYICRKDFFKNGATSWKVEKYRGRTSETYRDGLHIQYVNAEIDDNTEIARLMRYFKTADPEDMSHGALSRRVRLLKKEERGWRAVCEVTDAFWKDGYIQGEYRGEQRGLRRGERRGRRQGRRQGRREGALETLFRLVQDGWLPAAVAARQAHMELSVFEEKYRAYVK